MSSDRYAGLGPADRLEAQRRDEVEAERVRRRNEWFRRELALRRRWPDGEPTAEPAPEPTPSRRRGRPAGPTIPKDLIVKTYRELQAARSGRRPTQLDLAESLRVGKRTLSTALAAYELPWPIE